MILRAPLLLRFTLSVMIVMMSGCFSPAARFHHHAQKQGLERRLDGPVVIYRRGELVDGQPIHIYLDGDGTPALRHGRVATDPTSRDRLVLGLIGADPSTSVLVGRPCYYGNDAPDCDPELWTTARYSREVVDRIAAAINAIIGCCPNSTIVVIGYSGGGTLAMLAAPAIERVNALVTIAANLDIEAWVEHHGYAPLSGSLNPAREPPLRPTIKQFHFFGADDDNVPAALARPVISRQDNANIEVVAGFGHKCCWPEIWADNIARINRLARSSAARPLRTRGRRDPHIRTDPDSGQSRL